MNFQQWLEGQNTVRLYRGGKLPKDYVVSNSPAVQFVLKQNPGLRDIEGRWFTSNVKDVEWYTKENNTQAYYIDIPADELRQYNVRNFPAALQYTSKGKEDEEFILPKDLANQAKPY